MKLYSEAIVRQLLRSLAVDGHYGQVDLDDLEQALDERIGSAPAREAHVSPEQVAAVEKAFHGRGLVLCDRVLNRVTCQGNDAELAAAAELANDILDGKVPPIGSPP